MFATFLLHQQETHQLAQSRHWEDSRAYYLTRASCLILKSLCLPRELTRNPSATLWAQVGIGRIEGLSISPKELPHPWSLCFPRCAKAHIGFIRSTQSIASSKHTRREWSCHRVWAILLVTCRLWKHTTLSWLLESTYVGLFKALHKEPIRYSLSPGRHWEDSRAYHLLEGVASSFIPLPS